jgi:hypothetical protein
VESIRVAIGECLVSACDEVPVLWDEELFKTLAACPLDRVCPIENKLLSSDILLPDVDSVI